ncbi:CCA tRNA nucleotidyltransferase [Stieleria sp. JC731]|uniref:CCA tRNA nucleotidyltransferase n=1 Tax=Pirellulaceae TaxID=2691357 RepID=UPI001E35C755|nr:CCA tRNA nucleotidyltransferase [Stieleria sp. JC731]MCC9601625.1 CCA tRNA nucleotidyltransferase [Stieleria sp. JC731]
MLHESGHVAYFAGGCVRDALLNRPPKDFDVATDAVPDRVRDIFGRRNTLAFGASFGVIGVLPPKSIRKQCDSVHPTEVATFRSDGEYSDGRRPDEVHFGDANNDALRRDFTINGLFYDPQNEEVIDYVDGEKDLAAGRLCTIGKPQERFEEDKLRMLRAVRFATSLGFEIESSTYSELARRADEIQIVSGERIGAEMRRIVSCDEAACGMQLLLETGLNRQVFPDLSDECLDSVNRNLNSRSVYDFESSLAVVLLAISWQAGSGDSPKRFKSTLKDLSSRWKLSGEELRRVAAAGDLYQIVIDAAPMAWSELQPVLINRDIQFVIECARTVCHADEIATDGIKRCEEALQWPVERLNPEPLVTGDLLIAEGFRPGPQFRSWLAKIRQLQLDGELDSKESALTIVRELAAE